MTEGVLKNFQTRKLDATASLSLSFRYKILSCFVKQHAFCQNIQSISLDWLFYTAVKLHDTLMISTRSSSTFYGLSTWKYYKRTLWIWIFIQLRLL